MARVLVAANSTWNISNFRLGLIRFLLGEGHEVITLTPDRQGISVDGLNVPHEISKMDRSGANPLKDSAYAYRLYRVISRIQPDVFLGFTIKPNIYGSAVCRLLRVPSVPNVSGLGTAFLGSSIFRRAVLVMYRIAFSQAKMVFFQNADDERLFVKQSAVRPGQSKVLPGSGIDLARFSRCELPAELRFLMIARLLGDKGVREYVEAARSLKSKTANAKFFLLGEIDPHNPTSVSERELRQWIDEGDVDYLGSTDDVRPFIRDASVIVLPSYREGLPRTLLEGAAMGRPLIGTDAPGCREVVREGVTGFLCDARNAVSLAKAMGRMALTPAVERAAMGNRARMMVEEEFDETRVLQAYGDVLREI